jgi:hypothetical protein
VVCCDILSRYVELLMLIETDEILKYGGWITNNGMSVSYHADCSNSSKVGGNVLRQHLVRYNVFKIKEIPQTESISTSRTDAYKNRTLFFFPFFIWSSRLFFSPLFSSFLPFLYIPPQISIQETRAFY